MNRLWNIQPAFFCRNILNTMRPSVFTLLTMVTTALAFHATDMAGSFPDIPLTAVKHSWPPCSRASGNQQTLKHWEKSKATVLALERSAQQMPSAGTGDARVVFGHLMLTVDGRSATENLDIRVDISHQKRFTVVLFSARLCDVYTLDHTASRVTLLHLGSYPHWLSWLHFRICVCRTVCQGCLNRFRFPVL